MRKNALIIIALILISYSGTSQVLLDSAKGVEMRIHLIQKYEDGKFKCNAVGLSVINKTGKDIYIPNLIVYTMAGLSLYENINGEYKQNKYIFTCRSEKESIPPIYIRSVTCPDTPIKLEWAKYTQKYFDEKISSLRQDCLSKNGDVENCDKIKSFEAIGFLKRDEVIQDFLIQNIDGLENRTGEYRFSFDYKYANEYIKKDSDTDHPSEFYDKLMGYKLVSPEQITSNVVYFSVR